MMNQLEAAARQALEALDRIATHVGQYDLPGMPNHITTLATLHRDDLREALAEQPAAEPVAWQPIETAPKDGRKVILFYLNSHNKARTVMARWLTDEEAAETDGDGVGLENGWYECIDNWGDYTEVAIHEGDPSHWMHLPKAPAARSTTGSKEGGAA